MMHKWVSSVPRIMFPSNKSTQADPPPLPSHVASGKFFTSLNLCCLHSKMCMIARIISQGCGEDDNLSKRLAQYLANIGGVSLQAWPPVIGHTFQLSPH